MKVLADKGKCVGAGTCVSIAPEVFDQDDAGIVVVLMQEVAEDRGKSVQEAVDYCPALALSLSTQD
jgi:ferredoxin